MKLLILVIVFLLAFSSSESQAQGQMARAVRVEREYLTNLDDGKECIPIEISRKKGEQLDLVLPPLFRNSVSIWDEETFRKYLKDEKPYLKNDNPYQPIQRIGSNGVDGSKEIILPLTKLKDGTYYIWLVGDSVGGTFQIHLKTE